MLFRSTIFTIYINERDVLSNNLDGNQVQDRNKLSWSGSDESMTTRWKKFHKVFTRITSSIYLKVFTIIVAPIYHKVFTRIASLIYQKYFYHNDIISLPQKYFEILLFIITRERGSVFHENITFENIVSLHTVQSQTILLSMLNYSYWLYQLIWPTYIWKTMNQSPATE
jgi:hypothetical protein